MKKIFKKIPLIAFMINIILFICISKGVKYAWMDILMTITTLILLIDLVKYIIEIRRSLRLKKEMKEFMIEQVKQVFEQAEKMLEETNEVNKNKVLEMLNEFENLVKSNASYYTAQSLYVKIRRYLDDYENFLFEKDRIDIENILKPLEKQMMNLELVR